MLDLKALEQKYKNHNYQFSFTFNTPLTRNDETFFLAKIVTDMAVVDPSKLNNRTNRLNYPWYYTIEPQDYSNGKDNEIIKIHFYDENDFKYFRDNNRYFAASVPVNKQKSRKKS